MIFMIKRPAVANNYFVVVSPVEIEAGAICSSDFEKGCLLGDDCNNTNTAVPCIADPTARR